VARKNETVLPGEIDDRRSKGCAYCGSSGTLTREHLLPRSLSERTGEELESNIVTSGGHKVITSEPTIKDVCATCNNGPLSRLDEYICSLYDKYFRHYVRAGDRVKFHCDFDLLQRWLLKIGYNQARARGGRWPAEELREYRDYILGQEGTPPPSRIFLQLVPPHQVEPGTIKEDPTLTEAPIFNRIAVFEPSYMPGMRAGFLVTLYSYYFYVVIADLSINLATRKRMFKEFLKATTGGYELSPGRQAVIYSSSLDKWKKKGRPN
jgi:hypothetical protein